MRRGVIKYITDKKAYGPLTVIDVGGSIDCWSKDIADAFVDINTPQSDNLDQKIMLFQIDITKAV